MNSQADQEKHDEFLRLFSLYSRQLHNFVFTLVMSHADADEAFQETCVVLWKKFDSYDPKGSFFGWACQIAFFEVSQMRRKNKRVQLLSEEALSVLADTSIGHADQLDARQDALEGCVEKLPPDDRALIQQRYRQQLRPKEIATLSSRSVYSIYRALTRVHRMLVDCVTQQLTEESLK